MISTDDPIALRQVIRYYRQTKKRLVAEYGVPASNSETYRNLDKLDKQLTEKHIKIAGNDDMHTPEAWRN